MKAAIFCGGQGTRIRGVDEALPKPMLPIGNRPIVWHIMKLYAHYGVEDFVLCLGYKSWLFKEWFLNYRAMLTDITLDLSRPDQFTFEGGADTESWRVTLAETGLDTMTGGRLARIRRHLPSSGPLLVTYGDGVADIDISALLRYHASHGKVATLTVVRPPSRFGEMEVDSGRVVRFTEKPQISEGSINGGYFVFDAARIWDYLPDDPSLILEREPLQRLAEQGELAAYRHEGFWQPMDTPREFRDLNDLWDSGRAPWKVWPSESSPRLRTETVRPRASVRPPSFPPRAAES